VRRQILFGYVKPFKPELRICEYETYKAVYCGLCGQLGKSFGAAARLTLSYDFTFLCMLHYALSDEAPGFSKRRCYVNPLKKVPACGESEALRFCADTAAIMIYYKLLDNIQDEGFFARAGWSVLRPVAGRAYRKAKSSRPQCDEIITRSVLGQRELERRNASSVDEASEPTAAAMGEICKLLSRDEKQQRILERMGYYIGRYVYLCDALDDLEEDLSHGKYNPFVLRHGLCKDSPVDERNKVYAAAKESLYATIAEAAKAYELLEITMFEPILSNVLFRGMLVSVDEILSKKEKIR